MPSRQRPPAWLPCALLSAACAGKPPPPPPERPAPVQRIGTPHPFFVLAAAPDGRWVVACQSREDTDGSGAIDTHVQPDGTFAGDEVAPYLFLGGNAGAGEPLVSLVAAAPDGRALVVQRERAVSLLDLRRGERTLLEGADIAGPPSASFDRFGQRMAYVRSVNGRALAAIRDVESGEEYLVDPGPGALRAVRLDPDGEMLNVWLAPPPRAPPRPPARPAKKRPPEPPPEPPPPAPRCPSPAEQIAPPAIPPEGRIHRVALLPDGKPVQVPGLVRTMGRGLLRRGLAGELVLEDSQGFEVEWVPAECRGRLLHADPGREVVVVACDGRAGDRPWSDVELHGTRVHRPLGLEVLRGGVDTWLATRPRLFDLPAGTVAVRRQDRLLAGGWIDLDRKVVLPSEGRILWSEAGRALVRVKDGGLWLVDVDQGTAGPVPATGRTSPMVVAPPMVALDGAVVDLSNGTLVGFYPGLAAALDSRGRALVSRDSRGWGPLEWVEPELPAKEKKEKR